MWLVLYGIVGWLYESTYSTICERRWENRGFLYGPVCPIYGTGIVSIMALWQLCLANDITPTWWQVFIASFVGSAVLEYSTHWLLERLFHAYWWDYSNMPLNLNGRICLPASLLFGIGGLFVVYVLYEPTVALTSSMSPLFIEVVSLLLMATIASDTAITVSALAQFARVAANINNSVNSHMEQFVASAVEKGSAAAAGLQERRDGAADAIARERERFAAGVRDSALGSMGHYARAAARRIKGIATMDRMPSIPGAEYLSKLWGDVRGKHWPHN